MNATHLLLGVSSCIVDVTHQVAQSGFRNVTFKALHGHLPGLRCINIQIEPGAGVGILPETGGCPKETR
jgi:hypothetical protein